MKLLAIVITYFPVKAETERNLRRIVPSVDKLIVWENTPLEEREKYRIELPEFTEKVIYMGVEKNMCIAFPLNQAVKCAKENGFTHLLCLDQDSCFEEGHFEKYLNLIENCDEKLAIFGPNTNLCEPQTDENCFVEQEVLITSGTVFDIRLVEEVGDFNEFFKIDCVDYEFCFKIRQKGHRCLLATSVVNRQPLGMPRRSRLGYFTLNYSPFRLYYIARNNILLRQKFPEYLSFYTVYARITHPMIKILLSESDKFKKIGATLRGVRDGFRERKRQ